MHKKCHEKVIGRIEELITNGALKAGMRIPPERELAAQLQLSRNTVREGITTLAEKGVVFSRRGAGTFVAEGALACIIQGATRRHSRLSEIFELRKVLEPQIARLAAQRITSGQLKALKNIVEQQSVSKDQKQDTSRQDSAFHGLIVEAAGNSMLVQVYEALHDALAESRANDLQSEERRQKSLSSHRQLIAALEGGDADQAEKCMRQHMAQVETDFKQQIKKI